MSLPEDLEASVYSSHPPARVNASAWYASFVQRIARTPLRQLALELGAVLIAKLVALMLIWWMLFAPHPKPDVSADAIARRLAPATHTATEPHP